MKNLSSAEQSGKANGKTVSLIVEKVGSSEKHLADVNPVMGKGKTLNSLKSFKDRGIFEELCLKTNELLINDSDVKLNLANCNLSTLLGKQQSLSQNDCFHIQALKLNFSCSLDDYNSQLLSSLPNINGKCKGSGKTYSKDDLDIMSTSPSKDSEFARCMHVRDDLHVRDPSQNDEESCCDTADMCKPNDVGADSAAEDPSKSCSFNTALEHVPLAYNALTKSLVIQVQTLGAGRGATLPPRMQSVEELVARKTNSLTVAGTTNCARTNSLPRLSSCCLSHTGTDASLARTDASSSLSLSSHSTDFSLSTADDLFESTNFFDYDGGSSQDVGALCRKPFEHSRSSSMSSSRSDAFVDDPARLPGTKPKRRGFTSFLPRNFFSRGKSKEESVSQPGWKLFSKHPPAKLLPSSDRESDVSSTSQDDADDSPGRSRKSDLITPTSTLILESRPANLPAKTPEEEMKHKSEYEAMVTQAKKREAKDAKLRKRLLQRQMKQEDFVAQATRFWNEEVLPNWTSMRTSRKVRELWWQGLPPSMRGKAWKLAIGNDLSITSELYEICVMRAKERLQCSTEGAAEPDDAPSESPANREDSVELIRLDVSRTFPHLCIFQKGGPYHDLLQNMLGAYACYRPDVGYVQGMSFLAAMLLLNMDVADAFICFSNLLNRPCHRAFFRVDNTMMKAYFATYEELFEENLPKLYTHFEKLNVTADIYLIEWLYTSFSKSLPLDVACRVWDIFCRDGEEFFFRTALGVLRMYEDMLLNPDMDFIHTAQFLTKLPDDISAEQLFRNIEHIRTHVDKRRFSQVLAHHMEAADGSRDT